MIPSHIKALILDMDGVIWRADAPIGDLAEIFQDLIELLALPQLQPDGAVAGEVAGARQHEVSHAGQSRKGRRRRA